MRYALILASLLTACSQGSDDCAAEPIHLDCTPQYEPTFDNIYQRTVLGSCALSACHAGSEAPLMNDAESAYNGLVAHSGVCGPLAQRISSDDPTFQMPPGSPLSEGEQCAIMQWMDAGAPR